MLCHGGSYRVDKILYIFISLHLFELAFGAVFQAARTYLLLKENHYSIGTFKEKSFVGNYVSDSLHFTLAIITYSHCRQHKNSEICSINEIGVFLVSEANDDVARRIYVVQGQDGFSSFKSSAMMYKYLKVSTKRFCLSSFLVSCFCKLPVVIQEVFNE